MRVLYHHRTRGTDAQRIHILEIVKAFRNLGHPVEVAGVADVETPQQDATRDAGEAAWKRLARRVPFAYEAVLLAYNLVGVPLLLWKLIKERTDFIYERYSLFNFAGVLSARLCRIPIVLEVNSPFALEQRRDKEIHAIGLAQWAEWFIWNSATKLVAVSGPLRRILINAGVPDEKIVLMPNGVNPTSFRPGRSSTALRRSLGLENRTVIGFAGWFRNWHGLELLLEAVHESRLGDRGAAALLIGDGPAMGDVKQYVERHGLQRHVVFTGPLPHDSVAPYLDLVDIAVQPAANEYCCPMKILEYMALAKPIVAPRQENIQELLREGVEGEFFAPGDSEDLGRALMGLVGDPARRRIMGRKALEAIHERGYLWSRNAERVLEIVRESRRLLSETEGLETRRA